MYNHRAISLPFYRHSAFSQDDALSIINHLHYIVYTQTRPQINTSSECDFVGVAELLLTDNSSTTQIQMVLHLSFRFGDRLTSLAFQVAQKYKQQNNNKINRFAVSKLNNVHQLIAVGTDLIWSCSRSFFMYLNKGLSSGAVSGRLSSGQLLWCTNHAMMHAEQYECSQGA